MIKLGIISDNLSDYFMLKHLNLLTQEGIDCVLFTQNIQKPVIPLAFGLFQVNEIYDYDGTVIASDLKSCKKLGTVPGPKRKLFYVQNFEWTKLQQFNYNLIRDCYMNDEIELIARSKRHSDILWKCFKKPRYVMENWELKICLKN